MGFGASSASAVSVCVDGSLSTYAPLTSASAPISCQFQDLIFTFAFDELVYQRDPSQAALGPGDRVENHVNIAFLNPAIGTEGIRLTPAADYPWFAKDSATSDVNFTYTVDVATAGLHLQGATFNVDTTVTGSGGGGILAGETICCPDGTNASPQSLTMTINQFSTGVGTDTVSFARPADTLSINKDLLIATLSAGDLTTLNSFDQLYHFNRPPTTQGGGGVPEPGVIALTAGGLGLLLFRKFRSSANGLKALLAVGFLSVAAANASPLCTDTVTMGGNTLDKYIAAGSCIINGTLFGFNLGTYSYTPPVAGNGIGNDVQASAVTVSVLTGANPGFQFIGQWADSGSQSSSLSLNFSATAPSGLAVNAATFTTTTSKGGLGSIGGSSTVTNGVPPGGYTFPSGGTPIPVVPNLSTVTLSAIINLAGNGTTTSGSKLADNAHLSNLVMTVTEGSTVPEPMSALFLGGGLVVLSLLGRKRLVRTS
ncbi:MAG TPA: PEP-CTERM sorting domain-containing protein [Candidatus Acidoferrum sp.]|nr:PEP-CTERM sorting domain-containing protein [Candidatus Acidoferrum sp.]